MHVNTLSVMRRLEKVGIPSEQAEELAQVINEGEGGVWRDKTEQDIADMRRGIGNMQQDIVDLKTAVAQIRVLLGVVLALNMGLFIMIAGLYLD